MQAFRNEKTKTCCYDVGHMTKMAAMPIYGINLSKIFFSGTGGPISTKRSNVDADYDDTLYEASET